LIDAVGGINANSGSEQKRWQWRDTVAVGVSESTRRA